MRWRALLVVVAAGCANILGIDDGIPRDGGGVDAAPDVAVEASADVAVDVAKTACNPAAPFGAPVAISELNTSANEQHPRLTQGELGVTFQRPVADAGWNLFAATRDAAAAPFAPPAAIGSLDTPSNDVDLSESQDGLRAYFASDRAGGLGGYDVWQASRDAAAAPFGQLAPIVNVSSTSNDNETYYVPGALYLASNRGSGGMDIYRAAEQAGGFAAPLLVAELVSPAYDGFPAVTPDELRIYFASTRADAGTLQPYTATRASATAPWSTPTLVTELAGSANVLPGWISPDGCRLYFSSDQSGNYDLYVATKPP